MSRRLQFLLAGLAAVTVVYLALLLLGPTAALVRTPEYQLPVLHHGLWSRLPAAGLILAAGLLVPLLLLRGVPSLAASRMGLLRLYAALFLAGVACQLGPAAVHRYGLSEIPLRVYLPDHTSYFTDAAAIYDLPGWLHSFTLRIPTLSTHTRTHPPGAALLFYFPIRAMRAAPGFSDWLVGLTPRGELASATFKIGNPEAAAGVVVGGFLLLVAAAAVPLTFGLARFFSGDRRALVAAGLFAAMPAFAQKTPVLDHLLGFLALLAAWLCLTAFRERQIFRVAIAGALTGAGLWLGTSLLAAPPLCLLFLAAGIHRYRRQDAPLKAHAGLFASLTAVYIGSAALALILAAAAMGLNADEVYRAVTEAGWRFNNETSGRVHAWMWMVWDPYELLIFAGIPAGALALLAFGRETILGLQRRWDEAQPYLWSIGVFLAALLLSAKVVYEASRLAWFAFPLLAAAAAAALPDPETPAGRTAAAVVVGLTAASTLVFRLLF